MKYFKLMYSTLIPVILLGTSCKKKETIISEFNPVINFQLPENKTFPLDLDSVIIKGIEAPTIKQIPGGYFHFSFNIKDQTQKYFYKIFFQNESYKFADDHDLAHENFYGAWGETDWGFKEIDSDINTVVDSFRIAGNPRNELKYFGEAMETYEVVEDEIPPMVEQIKNVPEWFKAVEEKAVNNKRSLDEQLWLDAIYTIKLNRDKGDQNHRWKRNPRMGKYSAMLVVCSENDLNKIPEFIKDISKSNNDVFINPYYYFLHGEGRRLNETYVVIDNNFISLSSSLDLQKGIYINLADQQNPLFFDYLNQSCNSTSEFFRTAHVQQFFHAQMSFSLNTIPVIADVLADEYTIDDYKSAETNYKEEDMIQDYIRSSDYPCKTVSVKEDHIEIFNPKSENLSNARKENVGIKSRIGYTYGKFTAKIKFPSQINSTNVWTGLTNAYWLLYQDNNEWNNRRPSKTGYTEKGAFDKNAPRIPTTFYSEIDFEMVKTSQYWPVTHYPDGAPKSEDAQQTDDVIVTATNFDLCNMDPVNYAGGFSPVKYENKEYLPFRWVPWYQALTVRTPVKNSELYDSPYYYYQIEWKPDQIIWRIGPSKDDLRVIAYMNDKITSIPNNQMVMIITQEYHQSDWWPPIPFKQEYIPFLKNDLKGKIYSLEIE